MKKIITVLALLFSLNGFAQSPIGTYVCKDKEPKETDSLIIRADSTFRFAFYYSSIGTSEYLEGKWAIRDGELLLYCCQVTNEPSFKVVITNSFAIIKYGRERYMKKLVKEKLDKQ